jgi:hypothetical protein
MIQTRVQHRAFHPKGLQETSVLNEGKVFAVKRANDGEEILALFNVISRKQTVTLASSVEHDLLDETFHRQRTFTFEPYQTRWLLLKDE